jgi:hypothetical protein
MVDQNQPKSFFGNHLTSWPGFDPRDGKFLFLLFYLIWLSLSSESSQFKNFAKILKTLWENNIFNKKHVIIKKLLNILAKFRTGMILSSSWIKLSKKVKKEICHPGDRTQAKKSNDFQKMISVDFGQPLQPYARQEFLKIQGWLISKNTLK